MIITTLINEIKNQNLVTLPKGTKLYHGLRRKESQSYFEGTHWLTKFLCYAVDYAFLVDASNKNIITRDLIVCETIQDLLLVDVSNISLGKLTEKLNLHHNIDLDDRWIKSSFVENAKKCFNKQIHGYFKCTDGESDEYLICSVEDNLTITKIID
ncbi:MAG TPA: hypothetical protein DCO68_11495 [Methylophilaceae bacterium]|nr:hypothetical protein [Methylophilaceae bacterium]HAJ72692.1 hypothetical protein [Methylophilaceae bacterium]